NFTGSNAGQQITSNARSFAHIQFNGSGMWTLQDNLYASGSLTATAGTLSRNNLALHVSSDVTFASASTLNGFSNWVVGGNWTVLGTPGWAAPLITTFTATSPKTITMPATARDLTDVIFTGVGGS